MHLNQNIIQPSTTHLNRANNSSFFLFIMVPLVYRTNVVSDGWIEEGGLGYLVSDTDFKSDGGFAMFERNRHVFVHIE